MIDNTVMGSAKNGRMVNRMLALYTPERPKQTGHDCGMECLRSIDESVVLLNYERFYIHHEPETPNTICCTMPKIKARGTQNKNCRN